MLRDCLSGRYLRSQACIIDKLTSSTLSCQSVGLSSPVQAIGCPAHSRTRRQETVKTFRTANSNYRFLQTRKLHSLSHPDVIPSPIPAPTLTPTHAHICSHICACLLSGTSRALTSCSLWREHFMLCGCVWLCVCCAAAAARLHPSSRPLREEAARYEKGSENRKRPQRTAHSKRCEVNDLQRGLLAR